MQNVGTASTDLTIQYFEFNGPLKKTVTFSGLLPGRAHVGAAHAESGLEDNRQYSVVITSSGQPIAAVVNQHGQGAGDLNLGYEGLIQ